MERKFVYCMCVYMEMILNIFPCFGYVSSVLGMNDGSKKREIIEIGVEEVPGIAGRKNFYAFLA